MEKYKTRIKRAVSDYLNHCKRENIKPADAETYLLEILSSAGVEFNR